MIRAGAKPSVCSQHVAADTEASGHRAGGGRSARCGQGRTRSVCGCVRSARYLALTVDAPKQLAELVDDANQVLGPALGLELDVDRIQPWSGDSDSPDEALTVLMKEDPGADVDVVVGLIGALPRHTDSLHELGVATLLGKHMVLRGAGRADEQDAIEHGFTELSEDERARMVGQRKRHRALAVFLHELGHALGAVHEEDHLSLMHPIYDPKMSGFSGGGIALMRVALEGEGTTAVAQGQLDLLRGRAAGEWVAADRDKEIARLEAVLAAAPRPDARAAAASSGQPAWPARAARAPRRRRRALPKGLRRCSRAAAPPRRRTARRSLFFAAYPGVRAVQDLRVPASPRCRYLGQGRARGRGARRASGSPETAVEVGG